MSVKIMSDVWTSSKSKGTARLVLLAIADHANHAGVAFPSLDRIARYCNVNRRNVINAVNGLVERGELQKLQTGFGRKSTRYKVKLRGVTSVTSVTSDTSVVSEATPLQCNQRHPNQDITVIEPSYIYAHFDDFWKQYPKKKAKGPALKAFQKAVKKITPEELLKALSSYKFSTDQKYIPYPATWLNQERWNDEEPATSATYRTPGSKSRPEGNRYSETYNRAMARRKTDN